MADWRGNVEAGVSAWLGDAERPGPHHGGSRGLVRGDPVPDSPRPGPAGPASEDAEALGPDADPESVARTILLDQLTGRARSRQELADKLRSRNVPDDIAVRLLDRFTEVGLVDDAAFARLWVESRQAGKGLAKRALADELRRKGIDAEVARDALDELDPGAEEDAARALVRKKLRSTARLDQATATRRLVGMLARKGYSAGLAFAVVRQELGAPSPGEQVDGDEGDPATHRAGD